MSAITETIKELLPGDKSNHAAWLDGKDARLRVDKADIPAPEADEVIVKNHAIAINPVDWKIQDSGMFIKKWPAVLGNDIAGEVHEVGSQVTKFKKGDRVLAHVVSLSTQKPGNGGFQLYTAAPAVTTGIIPDSISFTEASVMPLAIDTAAHGLYDSKDKGLLGLEYPSLTPTASGKTILVWGGSSSVGAVVIQLAVASGANVVAVASKHNHAFVNSLGASATLDYNDPAIVEDVIRALQNVGGEFGGVYDAISSESSYKHVFSIAEKLGGGNVCTTLPPPKDVPANVKAGAVFAVNPEICGPVWEKYITPALEQGKLKCVPKPLVIGKGLEHVQKGLDTNKAGVSARKVVVEV